MLLLIRNCFWLLVAEAEEADDVDKKQVDKKKEAEEADDVDKKQVDKKKEKKARRAKRKERRKKRRKPKKDDEEEEKKEDEGEDDGASDGSLESAYSGMMPSKERQSQRLEQFDQFAKEAIETEWHFSGEFKLEISELILTKTCVLEGGQGSVYNVTDRFGRLLALKVKRQRDSHSTHAWELAKREGEILKNLKHPFIVEMYSLFMTNSHLLMAMEMLDRGCLWSYLHKLGKLPEEFAQYYGACVIDALRYLHTQNIVYRDMKAENIVFNKREQPVMIDFGMAKHLKTLVGVDPTATNYYTAYYLPPEMFCGPPVYQEKLDSWGIGVNRDIPWSRQKKGKNEKKSNAEMKKDDNDEKMTMDTWIQLGVTWFPQRKCLYRLEAFWIIYCLEIPRRE